MAPILYGIRYSPWTERARWALDYHGVDYKYREYVSLLGEPMLRWLGRGSGKKTVSVPLYRDGNLVLGESMAIIAHADEVGSASSLYEHAVDLDSWVEDAERALRHVRLHVLENMLADPDALKEAAAGAAPKALAGALRGLAAVGSRYVARKYESHREDPAEGLATMREVLERIRRSREDGFIGAGLSASDLVAATVLHGVRPPGKEWLRLGRALQRCWTWPELVEEYDDLLTWRDALYERYR